MNITPRVAVIGAGGWGKNHVRILSRLGALCGVVDQNHSLHTILRQDYPGLAVYSNHQEILADSAVDAVIVATPPSTHFQIARAALEADKDVLVEKPMTLAAEQAAILVSEARKRNKILMVGHLLLYKTAIQELIKFVQSGLIGEPYYIEMRRLKAGTIRRQENVLWSFAPHDLAVLLHLVDAPIEMITAHGESFLQGRIEDTVHLHITFRGKVRAHLHCAWFWPVEERKTIIVGSQGALSYDELENKIRLHQIRFKSNLQVCDEGVQEPAFIDEDALEAEVQHFLSCIRERSTPISCGQSGLAVIDLLEKAERLLNPDNGEKRYLAHQSAILDQPLHIGKDTRIWHFSHIMSGAVIGENCTIGQNVFIAQNAKIGNNVKIQNNVSIYEGVILEDDVFCGPSVVFTNIKTPRCAYPRNESSDYIATIVRQGASIGANATIRCGITIGRHALIGAGAVVTRDVPEYAVVYGNPAEIKGWVCRCGNKIAPAPSLTQCEICG